MVILAVLSVTMSRSLLAKVPIFPVDPFAVPIKISIPSSAILRAAFGCSVPRPSLSVEEL